MKLISKVLLLLTFFFVLIGKGYSVNDIYRAEQLLKNANTYYWYGRFRSNSLHEFEQSKLYCDSITRYLESYNGKDSLVLIRKSLIETEVSNLLITLSSMDTICVDNMNGRYPAYMELMGRSNEYEYFDDPDETGLEHALQELFKVPYPSKPIGERMFRVILIMRNKSVLLNEVAQQYIISHTNFFLTGSHEIPVLVDIHDINNIVLKDSILPNLCER